MGLGVWTAAQVKTKWEFAVSAALHDKGYETFVPAYVSVRQRSDRKEGVRIPLISGYVFVRTVLNKAQGLVVSTPGVMRMVGFGGRVVAIEEAEIERVRTVSNSSLKTMPWSYVKEGSQVRIARGSLAGTLGTLLQVKENTLLIVSIEMLQRSVAVHIDRSWVEPTQA